jgi:hypothetical protein
MTRRALGSALMRLSFESRLLKTRLFHLLATSSTLEMSTILYTQGKKESLMKNLREIQEFIQSWHLTL